MPALRFCEDGKQVLRTELFENDDMTITITCQTQIHDYCCVFKFLRRSVDGKHLMRFQSETSVFKFFRRRKVSRKSLWIYARILQLLYELSCSR